MPEHEISVAKVIAFPASKVWGEIRDFVTQTKHFGLLENTTRQASTETETCCKRIIRDNDGNVLVESCTEHSDERMYHTVQLEEPNHLGISNYHGVMKVIPLTGDGSALIQFTAKFDGSATLPPFIASSYKSFFESISSTIEQTTNVEVKSVGHNSNESGKLQGLSALVTGGGSGIGEAVCKAFAVEGARVLVADINGNAAQKVAEQIGGCFAQVDVTKPMEVESMVRNAVTVFGGRLDIVVNNAGITGVQEPTHEHSLKNWQKVLDVNLNGAFYVLRAALAQMKSQKPSGGVIVNMASTVGMCGFSKIPAYTAAKAALIGLTRSTAIEYATDGIRVVAVAPTVTRTPLVNKFLEAGTPEMRSAFESFNPIPGMPVPEDIANAIVFLSSKEARWISGNVTEIDGAYVAGTVTPHGRGST